MDIKAEVNKVLEEIFDKVDYKKGDIFVVGCSSSEVLGDTIGHGSSYDIGEEIFLTIKNFVDEKGVYLACQACEHLNRALVIEEDLFEKKDFERVSVVPHPKAGGSFATAAYRHFKSPVVVEFIKADFGLDIGDTLIGMHLKHVAVPLRIEQKTIGKAHVTQAYTRPKLIGGIRAKYE
ncbi:MAG: TIGR01440 family protein [Tissierellia bacterium]|nr:TIGR01440 family protein [Tissierellia bacterium]